jgi:hypothetical protein
MATVNHQVILYDDRCPMCRLYTGAFVRCGILQASGRVAFSQVPEDVRCRLDLDRARREIPLCDLDSGRVRYGLDALFFILGERFPTFGRLLRIPAVKVVWTPIYFWISFNRRMLAGFPPPAGGFDCEPPLHRGFWTALLAVAALAGWGAVRASGGRLGHPAITTAVLAGLPLLWWAAGAVRAGRSDAVLKGAGSAAGAVLATSVFLMLGLLVPSTPAAWIVHGISLLLLLHELHRRSWVFRPASNQARCTPLDCGCEDRHRGRGEAPPLSTGRGADSGP